LPSFAAAQPMRRLAAADLGYNELGVRMSTNAAEFSPKADDVFGRIAGRYDLLCDVFSLGIHRLWKRRVARIIASEPWDHLLDGATGTGDIILRMLGNAHLHGRGITAADLSPPMLAIAQKRLAAHSGRIKFQVLDAQAMPEVADSSVDAYSISLCLKICDRKRALREALRVLKPGGRMVVLEASNIPWNWLNTLYLAYMSVCMPLLGWLATGGDASAYKYLLQGIKDFPSAEGLAQEMAEIGFADVRFERLSLGIMAIHVARKPAVA
jgi:demethylmenaquinone methyltransferase / 2-methoxy-6-polyprenyl-1,4-benzoquinol methylase